ARVGSTRRTSAVGKHPFLRRLADHRRGSAARSHIFWLCHALMILTAITFIPAAAAMVVALLPRRGRVIQWFTLAVSLAVFALSLHLPAHYLYGRPGFQYEVNRPWISSLNIRYHVGVDGISLWLVVLSAVLAVLGVL